MEEPIGKDDLHGNVLRLVSSRPSGVLKHTASGRSTPRNSPRKWRTAQRELKGSPWSSQWFGVNRLIFWLVLITIWAYIGFLVQSKWAHNDRNKHEFAGYRTNEVTVLDMQDASGDAAVSAGNSSLYIRGDPVHMKNFSRPGSRDGVSLVSNYWQNSSAVPGRRSTVEHRSINNAPVLPKVVVINNRGGEVGDRVNRRNTSYGLLVGPFGKIEDRVLGWTAEKRKGTCERSSNFANLARSRKFVLIFHELSMTGAPISMMELATEILRCGGTVSVVVLSRKGGLLTELNKRGIKVLRDKGKYSFRAANRADLIVAGSAVCSSWIEDYLSYFASKSSRILWWIMENRREYFDRSKKLLDRVKVLMFLAESQSKQWLTWCEEEGIHLRTTPRIVPLSVNDELAFVAAIPCPLNDPSFTVMKMQEKRNLLRLAVRREFGLSDNDMLVMSLSSINPGKGQYYLVESVVMMLEQTPLVIDLNSDSFVGEKNKPILRIQDMEHQNPRISSHIAGHIKNAAEDDLTRMDNMNIANTKRRRPKAINFLSSGDFSGPLIHEGPHKTRRLDEETLKQRNLKVLIGSVGSKSNKILYIKDIMHFLSQHPNQSRSLLWTPATTHVASLYAAADVYVINAQGIGETFGRVTIEAMAFGLPVLGTDAGGTKEIVEDKVTGLLHPVGREGVHVLANNLQFLLRNSSAREEMGSNGRSKVEKMYMKHHMYEKLAVIFAECMRKRQ